MERWTLCGLHSKTNVLGADKRFRAPRELMIDPRDAIHLLLLQYFLQGGLAIAAPLHDVRECGSPQGGRDIRMIGCACCTGSIAGLCFFRIQFVHAFEAPVSRTVDVQRRIALRSHLSIAPL